MDIIRTVNRIEFATNSRWWLLAALLLISAAVLPALAAGQAFAIAVVFWLTRRAEMEDAAPATQGGAA